MESIIAWVIVFLIGYFLGKRQLKRKKYTITPANIKRDVLFEPSVKYSPSSKKFKESRWEDKDELFWGMLADGVYLERKNYFISISERNYFNNLTEWFGKSCHIHCQVALGQLLIFPVQPGFSDEERRRFFTLYNGMAMDFVLISKKTNKIVCVIELDDASHQREERIIRDARLDEILALAKIPFLHVPIEQLNIEPAVWNTRDKIFASAES